MESCETSASLAKDPLGSDIVVTAPDDSSSTAK